MDFSHYTDQPVDLASFVHQGDELTAQAALAVARRGGHRSAARATILTDILDEALELGEPVRDAARREAPALEWFFEDEREEPVIVKNLENIQGDERDIMLLTVCGCIQKQN